MRKDELLELIQTGEGEMLEFKATESRPNILARIISAFANNKGGTVLFGIADDGQVVGCIRERVINVFESALKQTNTNINANLQFVDIEDKIIGVLTIAKSNKLVSSTDGVYIRSEDKIKAMGPREMQEFLSKENSDIQIITLTNMINVQTNTIEELNNTIERLEKSINHGNKLSSKFNDFFVGGVVGALISIVISAILVI